MYHRDKDIIRLALFHLIYYSLGLLVLIVFLVLPLKYLTDRDRPNRIKTVTRICNMRDLENGTKSMPSGDSAACAFTCVMYYYSFHLPLWMVITLILLTMCGRVYQHCHWFGDTIVGAGLGAVFAYVLFKETYYRQLGEPFY
jgi:membrane-associated phospholipid phosphatase